MNCLVIYYSQTGGTKKIAQAIQQGVARENGQCDIKRLKEVKPEDWLNYDLVGIGSPVWSSCPTTNVIYHIKDLPLEAKGKHAFFFCTHGVLPGRCVIRGVQPMLEKGLTVIGWNDWYSSCSLPGHAKPWFTDGHPDDIDLAEAEAFGAAMVRHSKKISAGHSYIIPTLPTPEEADVVYGVGHPFIFPAREAKPDESAGKKDDAYPLRFPTTMNYVTLIEGMPNHEGSKADPNNLLRINPDKCTGCGRCAEACFCYNIDGSVFPPAFITQDCEHCLFCEGVCPTGALEFNFRPPNPEAAQMPGGGMHKAVDLAEAIGNFRRLTKEEDIGWSTPWEVYSTRPRHKEIP